MINRPLQKVSKMATPQREGCTVPLREKEIWTRSIVEVSRAESRTQRNCEVWHHIATTGQVERSETSAHIGRKRSTLEWP